MSLRHTILVLLFGGTLGAFLHREQPRGTFTQLDTVHRTFLRANRAPQQPAVTAPQIILARLDDVDQQANRVFASWPLNESDWQVILQNLREHRPRAVALDAPLPFEKAGAGMAGAAKVFPALVISAIASADGESGPATLPESLPVLKNVTGSISTIPEFKTLLRPPLDGTWGVGDIDLAPKESRLSVEGDWCRVPMLARSGESVVPSTALRALLAWAGVPPDKVDVRMGAVIAAGDKLRFEIDQSGFFRFYLSSAPAAESLNADTFALSIQQATAMHPAGTPQFTTMDRLRECLVWFAPDDTAARRLRLPNGTPVSAAEVTVRALAAIQSGELLSPLDDHLQIAVLAGTLLFCLWLTHWRKARLFTGAVIAAMGLIAASLFIYRNSYQWMPLTPSFAVLAATVLLSWLLPRPPPKVPAPAPPDTRRTQKQEQAAAATAAAAPPVPPDASGMLTPGPAPGLPAPKERKKKKRRQH